MENLEKGKKTKVGRDDQTPEWVLFIIAKGGYEPWKIIKHFLFRLLGTGLSIQLESLARSIKFLEAKIRGCYSENFKIESDDFVQMIVMDGCFIIELLRLYHKFEKEDKDVDDPIFTTRWMLRTLQRDLLMLENQLPFFVLKELFKLTSLGEGPSLIELTLDFFDPLMPRNKEMLQVDSEDEYSHLLDLFRTSFLSSVTNKKPIVGHWREPKETTGFHLVEHTQLIHCVTELEQAGVKFMKGKDSDLLDIEFQNRSLKIPTLYINNTVPMFLNFVAYEQCDEDEEPYFTQHFMFFDSLVNSPNDVSILHQNGIINHVLGSDKDVAYLFNRLGREIVYDVDDCHLTKQMKGMNDFYNEYSASKWHVWWTNLIRDYFSSPWTFLSLLAAVVLLILTVLQTILAAYDYFQPRP